MDTARSVSNKHFSSSSEQEGLIAVIAAACVVSGLVRRFKGKVEKGAFCVQFEYRVLLPAMLLFVLVSRDGTEDRILLAAKVRLATACGARNI